MSRVATTILYEDNPQGFRSIELDNWQGKAFVIPRAGLKDFKRKIEASSQAGVYILFGEDQGPTAYIGQTDNLGGRLYDHDRGREEEEWNFALVFVGNLDSLSIRILESLAVDVAKRASRFEISNGTSPTGGKYNEAQYIKVEGFFERMKLVCGLLGFPIFENPKEDRDQETYICEDVRNKYAKGLGTLLKTNEFVVFEGSLARVEEKPGLSPGSRALRKRLLDENIIKQMDDKSYLFTSDYIFNSPSAASDVIHGRSTNGWACWKNSEGQTLDQAKRK